MIITLNQHKIGDSVEGFLLIKSASKGLTNAGQPFLNLRLGDNSGSVEAKLWNVTEKEVLAYRVGIVVKVHGNLIDFRGATQLQLQHIVMNEQTQSLSPEDFMEKAPIEKQKMHREIDETISGISNSNIRSIVRCFIERYNQEFLAYPAAATIHHAFISGLAYHTVSMLRIAKSLCSIYPELNEDLLYAGVILHDIGKIHEFSSSTDTTRTRNGNLLGHIPIMMAEIKEVANELSFDSDSEEVALLQHMVLSHHGRPEWGSARTPLVQEAEILHMIDNIDAKMNTLSKALDKVEPGSYTEKLYSLDHRSFYKPLLD